MAKLFLVAKMADPEQLGGLTPSLHHHWFGFPQPLQPPSFWPSLIFTLLPGGNTQPTATNLLGCQCVWICMLDVVECEREGRVKGKVEGKQWRAKENESWTQSTKHIRSSCFFFPTQAFISIICTIHNTHSRNLCSGAVCALIWVCLRPPSMTSSWEKRTRSEGGQERQRKSRKAVNK